MVNSLGAQVPQLSQNLDDTGLFQQSLSQTLLPSQVLQTSMSGTALPFQTSSGVPNVGIGSAGIRQRQAGFSSPGFMDVQASLQAADCRDTHANANADAQR